MNNKIGVLLRRLIAPVLLLVGTNGLQFVEIILEMSSAGRRGLSEKTKGEKKLLQASIFCMVSFCSFQGDKSVLYQIPFAPFSQTMNRLMFADRYESLTGNALQRKYLYQFVTHMVVIYMACDTDDKLLSERETRIRRLKPSRWLFGALLATAPSLLSHHSAFLTYFSCMVLLGNECTLLNSYDIVSYTVLPAPDKMGVTENREKLMSVTFWSFHDGQVVTMIP